MKLTITDGKIGVRPPVTKPHPGFLHEVGEERFRKLVDDHYDLIKNSDIAEELALPPVKIHCSVLAEDAIKAALADYKGKQESIGKWQPNSE